MQGGGKRKIWGEWWKNAVFAIHAEIVVFFFFFFFFWHICNYILGKLGDKKIIFLGGCSMFQWRLHWFPGGIKTLVFSVLFGKQNYEAPLSGKWNSKLGLVPRTSGGGALIGLLYEIDRPVILRFSDRETHLHSVQKTNYGFQKHCCNCLCYLP